MALSRDTQMKDEMSSGSWGSSLPSTCNWFQALKPVAHNTMTVARGFTLSSQVANVNPQRQRCLKPKKLYGGDSTLLT
jgi:hypothetical protein